MNMIPAESHVMLAKIQKIKNQPTSAVNYQKMLDWLEKCEEERDKNEDRKLEIMLKNAWQQNISISEIGWQISIKSIKKRTGFIYS